MLTADRPYFSRGNLPKRAGRAAKRGAQLLLLCGPLATLGAVQSQIGPSFEVATVRACLPNSPAQAEWSPPGIGQFNATGVSLAFLIQMAFGLNDNQISGQPSWFSSQLYDIAAKAEAGVPLTREQLKPRLQELLRQRFHLATHYETKIVPGYALRVAKGGPKLQPTHGNHFPGFRLFVGPGMLEGENWSMPYLATMLQRAAGLPVVDETGIAGSYDIHLSYSPDLEADSSLPSLFTALHDTLGLELKAKKVPIQVLAIDHVERTPTDN